MSRLAKELLVKWITTVMYMMCSNYVSYSSVMREELALLTGDLVEELKK
jgi:hypothetical protein